MTVGLLGSDKLVQRVSKGGVRWKYGDGMVCLLMDRRTKAQLADSSLITC